MKTTTDEALFETTCSVKDGLMGLPALFQQLAFWTEAHTDVVIVNAVYLRSAETGGAPRLHLVLDTRADHRRACDRNGALKPKFRTFILRTFRELTRHLGMEKEYPSDALAVGLTSFSEAALSRATAKVLRWDKVHLLQRLSRFNVYDVRQDGNTTVFTFYTAESQEAAEAGADSAEIRRIFTGYLGEYERFGYARSEELDLRFDNLDRRGGAKIIAFPAARHLEHGGLEARETMPARGEGALGFLRSRAGRLWSRMPKVAAL